jgi:hypothetical protein
MTHDNLSVLKRWILAAALFKLISMMNSIINSQTSFELLQPNSAAKLFLLGTVLGSILSSAAIWAIFFMLGKKYDSRLMIFLLVLGLANLINIGQIFLVLISNGFSIYPLFLFLISLGFTISILFAFIKYRNEKKL